MAIQTKLKSLLSYVSPMDGPVHLEIVPRPAELELLEGPHSPFRIISDSDPLTRLVDARFTTDAGGDLRRVTLLIQKDNYSFTKNSLYPLTNIDIDQLWQNAFSFYSNGKSDSSAIFLLRAQLNEARELLPFQPLFFCKVKQTFFHPPCPECGAYLELCDQDDVLVAAKLLPYSSSLRRYLFCPSCHVEGQPTSFYTYDLEDYDSPQLKDRWALMKAFGQLKEADKEVGQFPCIGCPDHSKCYGVDILATKRISFFSFYPFYLLIFEAMTLHAFDFLSLVSGASVDEVKEQLSSNQDLGRKSRIDALEHQGQMRSPFFFEQHDKSFLEIMYLKLSFLSQIVEIVLSIPDYQAHPILDFSVDRFWVKINASDSHLPFFWSFKVKPIDIGMAHQENASFLGRSCRHKLYSLALIWFYTFIVNKKQDIERVYRYLGEEFKEFVSGGHHGTEGFFTKPIRQPFSPENIYWNPEDRVVSKQWYPLWQETLGLGLSLVQASVDENSQWSKHEFTTRVSELASEIKKALFHDTHVEPKSIENTGSADVHAILSKIREKWQEEARTSPDLIEETIVAPIEDLKRPDETIISRRGEALMEQTALESSHRLGEESQRPIKTNEAGIPETMIVQSLGKTNMKTSEDDIPETIIAQPLGKISEASNPSTPLSPQNKHPQGRVHVSEKTTERETQRKETPHEPEEDDFFTQTVFLSPNKDKNKD